MFCPSSPCDNRLKMFEIFNDVLLHFAERLEISFWLILKREFDLNSSALSPTVLSCSASEESMLPIEEE